MSLTTDYYWPIGSPRRRRETVYLILRVLPSNRHDARAAATSQSRLGNESRP